MEKVLVFGYKNLDIDVICFVIVYVELKKELGMNVEFVCLGEISGEI